MVAHHQYEVGGAGDSASRERGQKPRVRRDAGLPGPIWPAPYWREAEHHVERDGGPAFVRAGGVLGRLGLQLRQDGGGELFFVGQ
jgi:hypothetical protein